MTKRSSIARAARTILWGMGFAVLLSVQTAAQAADNAATTKTPDTPEAIWQAVDKETDAMAKLIEAGTLGDLHHHAFAVRDLVAGLPAASPSLPTDKLEKLKVTSKFVAILADRLDAAGDSNDKAAADANLKKLIDVLKTIREIDAPTSAK